jgi:type I restriction enzyme S subunit
VNDWSIRVLSDVIELQRGHDLPSQDRVEGEVPIIGSFGITGRHNEAKYDGPGVAIGRSGASIGTATFVAEPYWPLNTCLFVRDFKGNDERWVFRLLDSTDFMAFNSGSAQPSLNRNFLNGIPVLVPSLPEQRAIAEVLGALDDKIAANIDVVRIAMALLTALYDEKTDHASSRLVPVADLVRRLVQTRKLSKVDAIRDGVVPIFDQSDEGLLGFASGEGYFHASPSAPVLYFGDHTCKLRVATQDFFVGPNTIPFVGDGVDTTTLFFVLQGVQKQEEYKRHWQELMNKRVPLPEPANQVEITDLATGLFSLRTTLEVENRQLVALRDTLLPELMSGRLRVKDAEKKIEEVV